MLLRLMESFKNDFFVVYFDVEHNLDSKKANQVDLLYLLGSTIFQVAVNEDVNPDKKHLEELAKSIYTVNLSSEDAKNKALDIAELTKNLICFGGSMVGGSMGEKIAEAVLKPFNFTSGVSESQVRERSIEPQVQKIINDINLIIADVQTRTNNPLLVIVDGLDKLQRLEQAKLIYLESNALFGPLCRIIYTAPMLIFNSPQFTSVEEECKSYLLPNVKLYEKESEKDLYDNGFKTMRKIVTKRLNSINLRENDVFEKAPLDKLIFKSGGVIRRLIELIDNSFSSAEIKGLNMVNEESAIKSIDDLSSKMTARLTREMIDELREIRKNKRHSGNDICSELLHSLIIVAYRNKKTWFDVHPLVWDEL